MDWKARFKNKAFIVSLVSAVLVALQVILQPFGVKIPNDYVMSVVNAVLSVLIILGVIIDPTSPGVTDRKSNDEKTV